jgi:hypothetical protein
LSQEEIAKMKAEAAANADTDKQAKERAEKLNMADSLIFQTEKQMKEIGDKIPADKKAAIESALTELKEAHKFRRSRKSGQGIRSNERCMASCFSGHLFCSAKCWCNTGPQDAHSNACRNQSRYRLKM